MAIAHIGGGLGDAVRVGGGGVGVVGRVVVVGRMLVAAGVGGFRHAAGGIPSGCAAKMGRRPAVRSNDVALRIGLRRVGDDVALRVQYRTRDLIAENVV